MTFARSDLRRHPALLFAAVVLCFAASCGDRESPEPEPGQAKLPIPSDAVLPARQGPEPYGPISDTPPNIWFITVDTLRADHLGCYGYERDTSPFLDKLCEQSVRFDQALVQWPKTGPSVASILSSTYGSTNGVMRATAQIPVPDIYALLPEILDIEGGYETLAVITNVSLSPKFQYDQGFDRFELMLGGRQSEARAVFDKAQKLIEERKEPDAPFFLWTHTIDPHSPYRTPPKYRELFVGDTVYESDTRPPAPLDPYIQTIPGRGAGPQTDVGCIGRRAYLEQYGGSLREYVVEYDSEIRYHDEEFQRFLLWMRRKGHLDNTMIVLTADHGESLGDHGYYFAHGRFPYDACTRVPLIIHHPAIPAGVVAEPMALIDLAPTILDAVGLDPGIQMEGHSLLRWLMEPETKRESGPVFTESGYDEHYTLALRRGDYKLIKVNSESLRADLGRGVYELYNVTEDPGETVDLAEAEPEVFDRMKAELDLYQDVAYARVPPPAGEARQLTQKEKELLEALGYNVSGKMGGSKNDAPPTNDEPESSTGDREQDGR